MIKDDVDDNLGLILFLIPVIAYIGIFIIQYRNLGSKTLRLSVLSTRLATFLPLYAFVLYISLIIPATYLALQVVIAIVEAFSFYCFFALVVENLGGPNAAVAAMSTLKSTPMCCGCCLPATPAGYYSRLQWALFHFATTRVVLVIITAICGYKLIVAGVFVASFLGFFFTINAFATLVLFCEFGFFVLSLFCLDCCFFR